MIVSRAKYAVLGIFSQKSARMNTLRVQPLFSAVEYEATLPWKRECSFLIRQSDEYFKWNFNHTGRSAWQDNVSCLLSHFASSCDAPSCYLSFENDRALKFPAKQHYSKPARPVLWAGNADFYKASHEICILKYLKGVSFPSFMSGCSISFRKILFWEIKMTTTEWSLNCVREGK